MKDFTKELKNILKEDSTAPILSPDEVRKRANTMVILTNQAPPKLLALGGSSRKAILINYEPLMITFPDQRGVYQVEPDDIVFENHHTGRDVTEAGSEETPYEKFFAGAMKKFGVASPIELDPDDTKKFFNYVDKNWEAEEESDGSKTEILPAIAAAAGGVARAAGAGFGAGLASKITGGDDETEDVSTGKVGKKDKGSYQHAYKLALKKYQIHSADELDTPAERKGFTDYVDRLWKKGDIHRDKKKESAVTEAPKSRGQRDRERIKKQKQQQAKQIEKKKKEKPTFVQKAKAKASAAGSSIKKKASQVAADRKEKKISNKTDDVRKKQQKAKEQDDRQKEREREQASREKEREQKAKENDDDDDKEKGGFGGALSKISSAAKQQAAQYAVKTDASIPEVSPPDRKHQVKGIKKHMAQKKGKDKIPKTYVDKKTGKRKKTNPWALAWAQYDKYGVPSRVEKD